MSEFIPVAVPDLSGNEKKYVLECMDTAWISSAGAFVGKFEASFADYMQVNHALSCCNGTVALHLPLLAFGIKPGDEVLVPSFTYIATANAVTYCGATPVFVDCLPDTWNMDPFDLERKITNRSKVVIPVHLYGNPCDMDAIMEIAKRHDLFVLEDAAECHGATYDGRLVGTIGDIGTFSFFGNKIITTGEGGMIITDNDAWAIQMRQLKGQGMDSEKRYWFTEVGYNYRMTNIAAAIGLAQMEQIEKHIEDRRRVYSWYVSELESIKDYLNFQAVTPKAESVWWMVSITLSEKAKLSRDDLADRLKTDGIETRPLFYPMHIMPPYKDDHAGCPMSEQIAHSGINLPTHAQLTRDDVVYICEKLKQHITRG